MAETCPQHHRIGGAFLEPDCTQFQARLTITGCEIRYFSDFGARFRTKLRGRPGPCAINCVFLRAGAVRGPFHSFFR